MTTPLAIQTAILESTGRVREEWRIPGLAVWAGYRGRTLLAEGFGQADSERGAPVGPDTLFPIASVTKPLTVHALERLVRNGSINWSDRVAELVPGFALSSRSRQVFIVDIEKETQFFEFHVTEVLNQLAQQSA